MLTSESLASFALQLPGTLVQPDVAGDDAARAVHNAMIVRRPRAFVYFGPSTHGAGAATAMVPRQFAAF